MAARKLFSRLLNDVFIAPHDYMNRFGDNPHSNAFVNFISRPDTRVVTLLGTAFAAHAAATGSREESVVASFATLLGTGISLAFTTLSNSRLRRDSATGEELPMLYVDPNKSARTIPSYVADMARRDRDMAGNLTIHAMTGLPLLTATFAIEGNSLLRSFTAATCIVLPYAAAQAARYVRATRILSGQWEATTTDAPPPPPSPRRRDDGYGAPVLVRA